MPSPQARTSKSHPLQIATVDVPGTEGAIGVTLCPGKKDDSAMTGAWRRDLGIDVSAIHSWGAQAVVCLMESFELELLDVKNLPSAVEKAGIAWFQLPIRDVSVPSADFERQWKVKGAELRAILSLGGRVLVHCRGGLGRSGLIAARLLVEFGMKPDAAIALVRKQRPGAIETSAQENYVRKQSPLRTRKAPKPAATPPEDRAVGCLFGLALGDALGTTLEFSARDSKPPVTDLVGGGPFGLKVGEWTDDTSMALCLADSLLATGSLVPLDVMQRFKQWREEGHNSVNGHCFDIGITTSEAISRFTSTGNPLAGSAAPSAAGNGSIMRLAPVPIFLSHDITAAEEAAALQSMTTHAASECIEACRLMTRILVRLINGTAWQDATAAGDLVLQMPRIKDLAAGRWQSKTRNDIKSTGYVVDTLEAALWAVETTTTFAEAVLLAVNLGGDADTVGAVAGQLAGARYGYRAIPRKWVKHLAWSDRIIALARDLHRSAPGVGGVAVCG